jgi:hypothetical protein
MTSETRAIRGVALQTFQDDRNFCVIDGFVSFVANAGGETTPTSHYARTQLREKIDDFYNPKLRPVNLRIRLVMQQLAPTEWWWL